MDVSMPRVRHALILKVIANLHFHGLEFPTVPSAERIPVLR